ncbi:hypothetical protein H5410_018935 [Solanum commersonii]|uniref:Uncharacterized protein n=1 Tax=Solanum commersonii TaxID=4109 RepID=A0A9J6A4U2_SOLCO|nr:hypothetical protein H5410_018935 [Solanum commersonii]
MKQRKGKKATNVEVAQSSKPSTRRTTKKKESEVSTSKKGKNVVRHYGKTNNDDGATSESEITCTVASKFGGPRIAKKHTSDTSNYLTPRPHRSNLR